MIRLFVKTLLCFAPAYCTRNGADIMSEGTCVARDSSLKYGKDGIPATKKCTGINHEWVCEGVYWNGTFFCFWKTPTTPQGECLARDSSDKYGYDPMPATTKCEGINHEETCKDVYFNGKICFWKTPSTPKGACVARDNSDMYENTPAPEKCQGIKYPCGCKKVVWHKQLCDFQVTQQQK